MSPTILPGEAKPERKLLMIVGQKVGYARVSTNAQDLTVQLERLADCDRIFERLDSLPGISAESFTDPGLISQSRG